MTIEFELPEEQSHPENVWYDVHCMRCNDVSMETGDFIDRPLELIGFQEHSTLERAQSVAGEHDREHPEHKIVIRAFDSGLIQRALGIE